MNRIIDVMFYCSKSPMSKTNRYKTFFEEKQPQQWTAIRCEKVAPLSFFEKRSLKNDPTREDKKSTFSNSLASLFRTKPKEEVQQPESKQVTVDGAFYLGSHLCPYCEQTGFMKCGKCHSFSCIKEGEKNFTCVVCGNVGTLNGTIKSASGNTGNNNPNGGQKLGGASKRSLDR